MASTDHRPRLCRECGGPLTAQGVCTRDHLRLAMERARRVTQQMGAAMQRMRPGIIAAAQAFGELLTAMVGPAKPRPKSTCEQRWEDDGGTLGGGDVEGYEHTFAPAE